MNARRTISLVIALAVMVAGIQVAGADGPLPTIVIFTSSLDTLTVDEAESGTVSTTLAWHTVGMSADHRLTLHSYQLNEWKAVFDEASVPLEANGARAVTVSHTLNFGPPTYVLSIVDAQSRIVDQRTLTIPYDVESLVEPPAIDAFEADVDEVNANDLAQGRARVTVSWEVINRVPTSNLVFEQVFEDGTAQSVELPRPNLWIPSAQSGPLAPVYREGEDTITLRLRVVDVIAENVYDEMEITIEVTGAVTEPPPSVVVPAPTPEPPPPSDIVTFSVTPNTVNPGGAVTLAWEVRGTGGVTIEQAVPNIASPTTVVSAQSPKGSTTVFLPDYAAYSVRYTLWTANGATSASMDVQVHCPYTFFFGQGDGCPSSAAARIEAAYQPFEGGIMVWRGDTREIYVHYSDGTAAYILEAPYDSMPESVTGVMPPLDRFAPVSGFGRVWTNAPGVRDKLGWALEPESGYTMTLQQVAITRSPSPEFLFYLTLPDDTVTGTGFGRWRKIS